MSRCLISSVVASLAAGLYAATGLGSLLTLAVVATVLAIATRPEPTGGAR